MALPSSATRTTLHTTTSRQISSSTTKLQLTGAYIVASSSSHTTPLNQLTGAYTALTTGTSDSGIYTLVTQDGGLCRQIVTDTASITYASYMPATTLYKRDSATVLSVTAGTPTGGLPVGTTAVPVTDIPACAAVTATGSFQAPLVSGSENNASTNSNHGLSMGQKAGIAVGVVAAVVLAILAIVYAMYRQGRWRQGTPASRNIWGSEPALGATNTGMTQGSTMVSGMGLRDVLYNGTPAMHR